MKDLLESDGSVQKAILTVDMKVNKIGRVPWSSSDPSLTPAPIHSIERDGVALDEREGWRHHLYGERIRETIHFRIGL